MLDMRSGGASSLPVHGPPSHGRGREAGRNPVNGVDSANEQNHLPAYPTRHECRAYHGLKPQTGVYARPSVPSQVIPAQSHRWSKNPEKLPRRRANCGENGRFAGNAFFDLSRRHYAATACEKRIRLRFASRFLTAIDADGRLRGASRDLNSYQVSGTWPAGWPCSFPRGTHDESDDRP